MSPIMNNLHQRLKRLRAKYFVLALGLVTALGVANAGPLVVQRAAAAPVRDCSANSIDNKPINGGCGAATPAEFIADLRANNPSDLQTIYADARLGGLVSSKYERFEKTAKMGIAHKNGTVTVDGEVVMTDARSVGRTQFEGQRDPIVIGGKTYYHSSTTTSFVAETIPVMVMFDSDGVVEVAVLTACGNPMMAKKVVKKKVEKEKEVVKEKEIVVEKIEKKEEVKKVVPPPVMPKAGPEHIVGVFAGSSVAGTIAHGVYARRKRK